MSTVRATRRSNVRKIPSARLPSTSPLRSAFFGLFGRAGPRPARKKPSGQGTATVVGRKATPHKHRRMSKLGVVERDGSLTIRPRGGKSSEEWKRSYLVSIAPFEKYQDTY
ncbi:hypothetical protein GWI33_004598 [Rhynchophorus ferrugineus]|uniref:Uncharacterized protein n=1 Tax=Rhynchophorus ferrugineus TaxID=354439 RepID=A0A834MKA6_RHYFE|nr:hypothetical protein GWI33_004598 [Rhynchophorus ferrugineus]